jgi:predicted transcriptional regulator
MLTEKMAKWEELKLEISKLEADIKKEVLELGKTQQVGNVKASFAKGRTNYNYQGIAEAIEVPEEVMSKYTEQKTVTDWTKIVKELSPPDEVMSEFAKTGSPSVSLKIVA